MLSDVRLLRHTDAAGLTTAIEATDLPLSTTGTTFIAIEALAQALARNFCERVTRTLSQHRDLRNSQDLEALAIRRDTIEWDLKDAHRVRAIVRPRIGFAANRQTILVDAACAGLGIANLPEFLIEDAVTSGALVPILPDWKPSPVEMTALWQKDRITGRLTKAIVEEFVTAVGRGRSVRELHLPGRGRSDQIGEPSVGFPVIA